MGIVTTLPPHSLREDFQRNSPSGEIHVQQTSLILKSWRWFHGTNHELTAWCWHYDLTASVTCCESWWAVGVHGENTAENTVLSFKCVHIDSHFPPASFTVCTWVSLLEQLPVSRSRAGDFWMISRSRTSTSTENVHLWRKRWRNITHCSVNQNEFTMVTGGSDEDQGHLWRKEMDTCSNAPIEEVEKTLLSNHSAVLKSSMKLSANITELLYKKFRLLCLNINFQLQM